MNINGNFSYNLNNKPLTFGQKNQVDQLKKTDREVRIHEQAHQTAAGRFGGTPSYTFFKGPDGIAYAVGGQVPIKIEKDKDPNKTIENAEIIKNAALAPSDPSSQDIIVASNADKMIEDAKLKLDKNKNTPEKNPTGEKLNIVG
jgi:hypothetical protein